MPEVSIIIPVYNRSTFLRDAVASCFLQTHRDFEIVVVDDGSTEPVKDVLDQVAPELGTVPLRYVTQPHLGANSARNRGLRESSGEFVQFLDSDDLLHPEKLAVQRELLLQSPSLDMVFGLDEYFREVPGDTRLLWNAPDNRAHLDRFLWDDPVWHTGSPLWRRWALDRTGPWDETLVCWQDWEYHIRALTRDLSLAHVPRVLQYVREHTELRSINLASMESRERSKYSAAVAVASELKAASLWNVHRSSAVVTFLLLIARNLADAGASSHSRAALRCAQTYAETYSLRGTCGVMLFGSFLPSRVRIRHRAPVSMAHRVAELAHLLPRPPLFWHMLSADGHLVPEALVEATTATLS